MRSVYTLGHWTNRKGQFPLTIIILNLVYRGLHVAGGFPTKQGQRFGNFNHGMALERSRATSFYKNDALSAEPHPCRGVECEAADLTPTRRL